MNALNRYCRCA